MNRRSFLNSAAVLGVGTSFLAEAAEKRKESTGRAVSIPQVSVRFVEADGINVFYREAGAKDSPVILLLHGFPTSSFQYRELMPLLADRYRVLAPDLPGFGFTEVPASRNYRYNFDNLATTITAFIGKMQLEKFALYVFDYGAPTGFRIAMAHPEKISSIITQNGNAYEEGLGDAWSPIRRYWRDPTVENRNALREALSPEAIKQQYVETPHPELVKPEGYTLDSALMSRPGNVGIQLDLFLDYANNVKLYPAFQRYFREQKPKTLAVWGRFDPFFIPAGAKAFGSDNPNASVHLIDAGHFALETHVLTVAEVMRDFLAS
ncbi:MAG TPA: alpha/beta fold hydrolase [Bryobacteraceae bacterium]|nr:alpha/beta fold hydrolase [Bryobacteraceae bacterium]